MTPTTEAGRALAANLLQDYYRLAGMVIRDVEADILAIEAEAAAQAVAAERERLRKRDWHEVMLDALCESDGGNNPFYSDDPDAIALANELADAVLALLAVPDEGEAGDSGYYENDPYDAELAAAEEARRSQP